MMDILRRRWWWLLGLAVCGAIAALIFSKLVTPLYESSVVMYPSNSSSREKQLEEFSFGHEVQAERLMQLLISNTMLDSLEAHFHLADHYGFDKNQADWYDRLLEITHERFTFHKNKYVSVGISIVDADPEFCADVANEMARLLNVINADIVKSAALASLQVVEKEYERRMSNVGAISDSIIGIENATVFTAKAKLQEEVARHQSRIRTLQDSLDKIRRLFNVYEIGDQIQVLNHQLAEATANLLQETGVLEIIEQDPHAPDSMRMRHLALKNGAKMRADRFRDELVRLSAISSRYSALEHQLEEESELRLAANEELLKYDVMVDPSLESRRINRLEDHFKWDQMQSQELKERYQRAMNNYLDPAPAAIVVSEGKASHRKIYPHTLVNIALGTFGGLFFGLLLFSYLDRDRSGGRT